MAPLSSQPRVHKWAGSTTGWALMRNGDSDVDTWCLAMKSMCQIMFYNHLATFGTIVKSAKGPQVGWFHNGKGPDVERDSSADTWCPAMQPMCQITFYTHLATFVTIVMSAKGPQVGSCTTGWVLMWNGDSGADTWCLAMETMCQIMFYNHFATFGNIVMSANGPQVGICTTGWALMWIWASGGDTWCPFMGPICQIMFYNHLATFGTIVKSAKGQQVSRFHNGKGSDVERGQCQIMFYNHLATFGTIVKSAKGPQVSQFHNRKGSDVERG